MLLVTAFVTISQAYDVNYNIIISYSFSCDVWYRALEMLGWEPSVACGKQSSHRFEARHRVGSMQLGKEIWNLERVESPWEEPLETLCGPLPPMLPWPHANGS